MGALKTVLTVFNKTVHLPSATAISLLRQYSEELTREGTEDEIIVNGGNPDFHAWKMFE